MNNFKVHLEFGVIVLESVITVRGRDQDLLYAFIDESFDVFFRQSPKQFLIARLADAFATAIFLGPQYSEIHSCLIENVDRGLRHFLQARVIAEIAAGKI